MGHDVEAGGLACLGRIPGAGRVRSSDPSVDVAANATPDLLQQQVPATALARMSHSP